MRKAITTNRRTIETTARNGALNPTIPFVDKWCEFVDITPSLAADWMAHKKYEGQRKPSRHQIRFLVQEMTGGHFGESEFHMAHVGEFEMLINGQHRLLSVIESGVTLVGQAVIHKTYPNLDAVARAYATLDINRTRTHSDAFSATNVREESGLSIAQFNAFTSALGPIVLGFTHESFRSGDPRLKSFAFKSAFANQWVDEARQFFDFTAGASYSMTLSLRRKAVLSVALTTLRYQPAMAETFWRSVADNDGLRKGEPCHTLHTILIESRARDFQDVEISRKSASCWSAYRAGKGLSIVRIKDPAAPIKIGGTPYDGKEVLTYNYSEVAR